MTQQEKQLLLKDLSARLPYNIIMNGKLTNNIGRNNIDFVLEPTLLAAAIACGCKPYLRPMSSMTKKESAILTNIANKDRGFEEDENGWIRCDSIHTNWGVCPDGCAKLLDYLNSIHVDYRGLIPMGLALPAPEGMYNTKTE